MLQTLIKLDLLKLFLLAILLRVLIMPFYFHPDIKTYNYQSSFLKSGVFDIYTHLVNHKAEIPIKEEFVYFPLTYFFLGSYQMIASSFLGSDFHLWLSDASADAVNQIGTFRYLFILKLPYLVIDLLIAFLLIKFQYSSKQKKRIFILWLFNPFSIAIIYVFSNVDIIPLALSLLSIHFLQKKKLVLSAILLGVAIGFKSYPLLFLPFLFFFVKDVKKILLVISIVLFTVGIIIAPFFSDAFLQSALISSLTTRLAFPGIGIGFGEGLMIGIVSLTVLFFVSILNMDKRLEHLWYYLFAALLITISSIHFHIQWLLWIMPFIILFHISEKNISKLAWIWIALAILIPLLYDDKSMTISTLSPISLHYKLLPTPFSILEHFYDPYLVQGFVHSLIFGTAIVLVWKAFKHLRI